MLKIFILLSVSIYLLTSCVSSQPNQSTITGGDSVEYENIELVVDDEKLNSDDVFSVIEPLWWSVSIYDDEKKYYEDLSLFTDPQKYVFAIQWYLSEVNNGGHDQFYFNSTGIVWEEAMIGFRTIGLNEGFDILQQSTKLMGGNPSKDREERQDQLEKYEPEFESLDNKLYEIEDQIENALLNYIRTNKKYFKFKGIVRKPL